MSSVLYYSNYCKPSQNLLQTISKSAIKTELHFVCIDKRIKNANGETLIVLENNQNILLPPHINQVPALLTLNGDAKVIFGEQPILEYLRPRQEEITQVVTNNNIEPLAFSMGEMAGSSDNYSYLDMTPEDLMAKGEGGLRMMHSYATINYNDKINTPDEDYVPDKVGSVSLDQLQSQRNKEIS